MVEREFGHSVESNALTEFALNNVEELIKQQISQSDLSGFLGFSELREQLIGAARSSHLKILRGSENGLKRAEKYHSLSYSVIRYAKGELILPDTMLAFISEKKVSPFCEGGPEARVGSVLVPLSCDRLLVGTSKALESRSAKQVCRILASCSLKGFIAKENTPRFNRLRSRIGKNAELLSSAEINSLARQTLKDLKSGS